MSLSPVTKGKSKWVTNGYYVGGKRVQRYFVTKAEGLRFIEEQDRLGKLAGRSATDVPPWVHTEAVQAYEILAPLNISVLEAAKMAKAQREKETASVTVTELVEAFILSRRDKDKSPRTLQDARTRCERFAKTFGEILCCNVSTSDVDDWIHGLRGLGPVSKNNFRRGLHGCFAYAVKRGWAARNPVAGVEKITVEEKSPGILTPSEARALLTSAHAELVPYYAIGLFAGLRPQRELGGLDWRNIHLSERKIEVNASSAKTRDRRFVSISDNLAAWLEPHRRDFGPICEKNFRKVNDAHRRKNGWGIPGSETAEEKEAGISLRAWPSDAMRHSFASYHVALHKNAALTANELGHKGNTAMLFNHYRELVKLKDAEAYWGIFPPTDPASGVIVPGDFSKSA